MDLQALIPALLLTGAVLGAHADDRCGEFKWNVTQERSLFATQPQAVTAAPDGDLPPLLSLQHFYYLSLSPQAQVHFPVTPGRMAVTDGAYGGIARLHVTDAGLYRVALDSSFWVDVVHDDKLLATSDFVGQQGCDAPHKIVQFEFPSGDLILQISGGTGAHVHLAITRAPAATAH